MTLDKDGEMEYFMTSTVCDPLQELFVLYVERLSRDLVP